MCDLFSHGNEKSQNLESRMNTFPSALILRIKNEASGRLCSGITSGNVGRYLGNVCDYEKVNVKNYFVCDLNPRTPDKNITQLVFWSSYACYQRSYDCSCQVMSFFMLINNYPWATKGYIRI